MPRPTTRSIQEIIRFCARALPALDGDTADGTEESDGREAAEMAAVFRRFADACPEAGAVYWGCRVWQLWMWQPVYLGVWAASVQGVAPDFSGFRHRFDGLFTARYRIAAQDLAVRDRQEAAGLTAVRLKAWMADNLPLMLPHYPLSMKLAEYFLGDAVLKALSAACLFSLLPRAETEILAAQWLKALALPRSGNLVWMEQEARFRTELSVCCQHFRREAGVYCEGCPKTRRTRG